MMPTQVMVDGQVIVGVPAPVTRTLMSWPCVGDDAPVELPIPKVMVRFWPEVVVSVK